MLNFVHVRRHCQILLVMTFFSLLFIFQYQWLIRQNQNLQNQIKQLKEDAADKRDIDSNTASTVSSSTVINSTTCQNTNRDDNAEKAMMNEVRFDYLLMIMEATMQLDIMRALYKSDADNAAASDDVRHPIIIKKAILITDFYNPKERRDEPVIALQANLLNYFIEEIHLLTMTKALGSNSSEIDHLKSIIMPKLINSEKIRIVETDHRMTVGEILEYANGNLKIRGKPIILSNNDIIFDNTLINLEDFVTNPSEKLSMWGISRRRTFHNHLDDPENPKIEIFADMCMEYVGSHDAFVFSTPVPSNVIGNTSDFTLGLWGCENRLLYAFHMEGYEVDNPCFKINLWHYSSKVYGKSVQRRVNEGEQRSMVKYPTKSKGTFYEFPPNAKVLKGAYCPVNYKHQKPQEAIWPIPLMPDGYFRVHH